MFQYDHNKVYRAMTRTLDAVEVPWGEDGVNINVESWAAHKGQLVDLLRQHPDWNEDALAIITKVRVANHADSGKVREACCEIQDTLYFKYNNGDFSGYASYRKWATPLIDDGLAASLQVTSAGKLVKPIVGQKTTRYLRQLFLAMGVAEDDKAFWKLFQRLADEINVPEFSEYPFIISVNPADYLTMSYGTTWASCHIINPEVANTRNGSSYDGCYKAGCLSYLCDPSSIITYTVDKLPADVLELPYTRRHTRQMFFVNIPEQAVMQSRLYPYTHDEKTILAQREILQGVLAQCFGIKNEWTVSVGYKEFTTVNNSHHYRDYDYWSDNMITTSTPHGKAYTMSNVYIGNVSHCLKCGDCIYEDDNVFCDDCSDNVVECYACGHEGRRSDEDMHEIEGDWYCEDCCFYCDYHEEWESGDDYVYVDGYGRVCDSALHNTGNFFYDEGWSEWLCIADWPDYIFTADGYAYRDIDAAIEDGYAFCEECGELHLAERMHERIDGGYLCNWCYKHTNSETCPHCGKTYNTKCDETCPHCGVIIEAGEAV